MQMADFSNLERVMNDCMVQDWLAGYSINITQAGEPPYVKYAGYADRDAKILIQENTLFRIMSMGKPMTAAAAMALVERGMLRLDDPVRKYAPCTEWMYDGKGGKVPLPPDRDLTVLHLLNHTNGLGMSYAHMDELFRATAGIEPGLKNWAEAVAAIPLEFLPGNRTGYSSYFGYTLLGYVLEAAAGMPFQDVLKTYLHDPLGMEPPKFWLKPDELPRLSRLYEATSNGLSAVPQSYFPSPHEKDVNICSGAGGQFMTLGDCVKFAGMLAGEGLYRGSRVLRPETVQAMHTDTLPPGLSFEAGVQWGLGMAIYTGEGNKTYSPGSFYWGGYYGNQLWVDPARRLSVVYMFNLIEGHKADIQNLIEREVYAGLELS